MPNFKNRHSQLHELGTVRNLLKPTEGREKVRFLLLLLLLLIPKSILLCENKQHYYGSWLLVAIERGEAHGSGPPDELSRSPKANTTSVSLLLLQSLFWEQQRSACDSFALFYLLSSCHHDAPS